MSQPLQSQRPRASQGKPARSRFAPLLAVVLLAACGKQSESAVKPVVAKPVVAQPTPSASLSQTDADLLAALNPETSEPGDLVLEARRVMDLYPEKNAEELLSVPEVNPKLVDALKGLAADPQLQAAINRSVDLAAHFKGFDAPAGAFRFHLDTTVYDDARTERMLSAVLSGQPRPIVQFLGEELGEASFEFNFTDAEKTSNGISLEPNSAPPAPPANTDPD